MIINVYSDNFKQSNLIVPNEQTIECSCISNRCGGVTEATEPQSQELSLHIRRGSATYSSSSATVKNAIGFGKRSRSIRWPTRCEGLIWYAKLTLLSSKSPRIWCTCTPCPPTR